MNLKVFFRIILFLLALNFLSENLGYLTHQLYQFLGLICLIFYGLSIFPFGKKTEGRVLSFSGCLLLVVSIFFFSGPILLRLVGTAIFLFSLGLIVKSKGKEEKEMPLLFLTVTCYFYFMLFYLYSPPLWYALQKFSFYFSRAVSVLTGVPLLYSSTFLGLPITFLFFIFFLLSFLLSDKRRPILFYLALTLLVLLSGGYFIIMGALPSLGKSLMKLFSDQQNFLRLFLGFLFEKDNPLVNHNYQMNGPLLLFLLYLIPLILILWGRNLEKGSLTVRKGRLKTSLSFLCATTMATAILVVDRPATISEKKGVVLYNKGFLNWEVPNFRMFGSKSAGMFGNLPPLLEAMGFTAKRIDELSVEALQDAKVLVMINVDKEIPQGEREAIWHFVENGGSLLLLGDHTFYKHGVKRIILNDILEPYHIRFNFDSADWFVGGWLHSYSYASHPITVGMRDDMNDAGIVIGASLAVRPPAFPLVIGKYGFSDPGNESEGDQRGYLGNLNYDPGEMMGDVVLCGAQHYGKGKVLVFGDTSSFANAIMINSYDFVNRVFTWLAKDESPKRYRLCLLLSLVVFTGALFLYLGSTRQRLLLLISLLLALGTVKVAEGLKHYGAQRSLSGTIAYVDISHGERFSPESWNENATMGLHLNLMRNGYLPFSLRTFERQKLEQADLLIVIAPSSPFKKKEMEWIKGFVDRGGTLMVTVGWEEREASASLLTAFGFSIDYLPLAQFISVIPYANQKVRFFEAWPVVDTDGRSMVIAAYLTYPVAVKKVFGKGKVILIGDSSFFWNKNLEMEENYTPENVQFLQWLLSSMRQDEDSR